MFEFPKLVFLLLVAAAVWIIYRWINAPGHRLPHRRAAPPPRALPAEDLFACRVCRAYVATGAPACARPDCPQRH